MYRIQNLIQKIKDNEYNFPININIICSDYDNIPKITNIFNSKSFQKQIIDYINALIKNPLIIYMQFHTYENNEGIFFKIKISKHKLYKLN